jgi:hypothetical protein
MMCVPPWANGVESEPFVPESVGARAGFSATSSGDNFYQSDAFANWNLPWGWELGKEWHLQTRLDFAVGWLGEGRDNGVVGSLGPSLVLSRAGLPVSLDGGISPTLLSRSDFGVKNFSTDIQFTTHVGVNWDFATHWRVSYRFQHMSNANLGSQNPGLNMHFLGLSYVF